MPSNPTPSPSSLEKAKEITTKLLEIKNDALYPVACSELIALALSTTAEEARKVALEEAAKVVCLSCHHGYSFSEDMPEYHRVPYRDTYSVELCKALAIRKLGESTGK